MFLPLFLLWNVIGETFSSYLQNQQEHNFKVSNKKLILQVLLFFGFVQMHSTHQLEALVWF